MATHSSVLARRIPGMGEPGRLPSMGSHRVGHKNSDHRVPEELGQESQASSCVEEWNSACLSSCSRGDRSLLELSVVPAGFCGLGGHRAGRPSCRGAAAKSLQSCPTLCDPIDVSPPGSPVPGILQARTLERVAISFSNA